jgi:hypothetical protein
MCIKSNSYSQVQELLATHLPDGLVDNPHRIEFTGQSTFSQKPVWNGPFAHHSQVTLAKMLRPHYGDRLSDTIYYDILPFTLEVCVFVFYQYYCYYF